MFVHLLGQTHDGLMHVQQWKWLLHMEIVHCLNFQRKKLQIYPNIKNNNSKEIKKQTYPNYEIQYSRAKRWPCF
jgi:hypothetical protein